MQTLRNFLYMLRMVVVRSHSDDNVVRYLLPVLWITPCFHTMGQMQMQAWSLRRSELFTVTRQLPPLQCAPGGEVYHRHYCFVCTVFLSETPCLPLRKLAGVPAATRYSVSSIMILPHLLTLSTYLYHHPYLPLSFTPGSRPTFLWSPYVIGQTIIFLPCDFYLLLLLFFPRLISAVGDWMSTILLHMAWP